MQRLTEVPPPRGLRDYHCLDIQYHITSLNSISSLQAFSCIVFLAEDRMTGTQRASCIFRFSFTARNGTTMSSMAFKYGRTGHDTLITCTNLVFLVVPCFLTSGEIALVTPPLRKPQPFSDDDPSGTGFISSDLGPALPYRAQRLPWGPISLGPLSSCRSDLTLFQTLLEPVYEASVGSGDFPKLHPCPRLLVTLHPSQSLTLHSYV